MQTHLQDIFEAGRIGTSQRCILAVHHHFSELWQALSIERLSKHRHHVQKDTKSPDVALGVVRPATQHLWRHILRGSYLRVHLCLSVFEDGRYAKVAELDDITGGEEDVIRFNIPVQYLAIMTVFEREADLSEVIQDLLLWHLHTVSLVSKSET